MPRPPNSLQVMHNFTPETLAQVADLAKRWGGLVPLPKSQVIREAIRRCWLAEQDEHKNGKKKP
jgi:hypothetical protein